MRVLVLEDDRIQAQLCRNWLAARGHEVTWVPDGDAAVGAMLRESFDAVVLDWMTPGLSGQDVLDWMRASGNRAPVLFATCCSDEDDVASILDLGADDYVVKPLRAREYVARVEALARRART